MNLLDRPFWVFDLDGTLTEPILDFPAIKRALGLPIDRGILEEIAKMEPEQARVTHAKLAEIELGYARKAQEAPGASVLLEALANRNVTLGILTRNKKDLALVTLEAIGCGHFFKPEFVFGRDEAEHKPSPQGLHRLMALWDCAPQEAVMVGDYLFDLQAGKEAGMATVYVDHTKAFPYKDYADLCLSQLDELVS